MNKQKILITSLLVLLLIAGSFLYLNTQEDLIYDGDVETDIDEEFEDLIEDFISSYGSSDPANPLDITKRDIIFVQGESYIDLYVRKREEINSVLIIYVVEENSGGKKMTIDYGLRALEYNKINGDETRILNGVELGKEQGLFFLVDSTTEPHTELGQAFRIRIPTYVQYGYTKENFGLVRIGKGSSIKIRTFERPYADYTGAYEDNTVTINTIREEGESEFVDTTGNPVVRLDPFIEEGSLKITEDDKFIVAYIRYEDDSKFFKDFLVKDKLALSTGFKPVSFLIEDTPEDNKALLLSSIYQDGYKIIRAKLYFERRVEERMVEVSARDYEGNQPSEPLEISVPRIGDDISGEYEIDDVPGGSF